MHTELDFAVETKTGTGKGTARKLRVAGKTPAVVYGYQMDPVMVTFREQDLAKALSTPAGRNVFLKLKTDDAALRDMRVLIKDLQVDPVRRVFIHADFYKLDASRAINTTLPIRLEGTAVGVKMGGIMQIARRELRVVCLPDSMPEAIVVDVSNLKPGESIHVGDLPAPEGVQILSSPRLAVCAVIAPSGLEEEEGEEEAAEEEAAEDTEETEE